jgi:hypothetical protein
MGPRHYGPGSTNHLGLPPTLATHPEISRAYIHYGWPHPGLWAVAEVTAGAESSTDIQWKPTVSQMGTCTCTSQEAEKS